MSTYVNINSYMTIYLLPKLSSENTRVGLGIRNRNTDDRGIYYYN